MKKLTNVLISIYLFLLSWDGYLLVSGITPFSLSFIPLAGLVVIFLLTVIKDDNVYYNKIILAMGLMLIYMLFSILWTSNNNVFKSYLTLASYFLTAVIIYNLFKTYKLRPEILFAFYLGVLSIGLYAYFTGDIKDMDRGRFTLTEGFNPTWFAAQIVWALILSIYLFVDSNKVIKGFIIVGAIALFYLLLLTGGRNALLSLVVGLILSLIFVYRRNMKKMLMYFLLIGVIAYLGYVIVVNNFGVEFLTRISDIKLLFTDQSDIATAGRTSIWGDYLDVIPNYLLFGSGFRSSMVLMDETGHNIILTLVFELGIIGLFLYLIVMYLIIKPAFNLETTNKLSFMTLSFSLFLLGLGNDTYYYKYWWTGIFIYFIILISLKSEEQNHEKVKIKTV